jgi:hypothetical protein
MTGTTLCTDALRNIGVLRTGQTANPSAIQDVWRQANMMIKQWSIQRWTVKVVERRVNPVVNGVDTYTIGPTGDWVTDLRPTTIDYCTMIQTASTTATETPIIMATEQQWAQRVYQKALPTSPPALIYIRYTLPNLTAQVWPVPTATGGVLYSIGIYYGAQLAEFPADLSLDIALQPGFEQALVKCLAVQIWPMFMLNNKVVREIGAAAYKTLYDTVKYEGDRALGWIKSLNAENTEMACDTALNDNGGWYNVYGDTLWR